LEKKSKKSSKKFLKKFEKSLKKSLKKFRKKVRKIINKSYKLLMGGEGREGGWIIVIQYLRPKDRCYTKFGGTAVAAWSSGQDSGEAVQRVRVRTRSANFSDADCYYFSAMSSVSSGEVMLPLKYLKFVSQEWALENTSSAT
jgi:hypothetical protein